jgi:hypothetical protein
MSFKQILIVVLLIVLVGGTATFLILKQNRVSENITEVTSLTPVPTSVPLLTWTDEAGFSFQYPQGSQIDNHPDDTKDYANLTLTLPSSGIVNIIMTDNTYKDLTAWAGQNLAIDTTLGGKAAKKINVDGQTTVACIDSGILVTITGQDIATIVDSWTFIYPTPTTGIPKAATTNDSGGVLEEE